MKLLAAMLVLAGAAVADTIQLAGSFNDWSTNHTAYTLQPAGTNAYELITFFRAGQYRFKFLLGGDWAKSFGAGADGRLAQPGTDIPLVIPKHGDYRIRLVDGQWTLTEMPVKQPHAVVNVIGPVEINVPVTLDASESVARPGREISRYTFSSVSNAGPTVEVRLTRAGTQTFTCVVNDGIDSAPATITLQARTSYQCSRQPMRRTFPGLFECVLKTTNSVLVLTRDHTEVVTNLTLPLAPFWRIQYDERTGAVHANADDYTEFTYRPNGRVRTVALAGSFNGWSATATPMAMREDGTYAAYLKLEEGQYRYKFVIDGDTWVPDLKVTEREDDGHRGFNSLLTIPAPPSSTNAVIVPEWARHAVWYQIFPDRFRNGNPSNDPPHSLPWQWNWYRVAAGERPNANGVFSVDWYSRRFGGDLQGVIEKLPYLRDLGVTALYFCPVFESGTNHGYDTWDYRHISRYFGVNEELTVGETPDPATWQWTKSDELFREMVRQAHGHGMKVIIDGVFNHMGKGSFALQEVLSNGVNSVYADWFDIEDWGPPIKYKSWDGGGSLPNFRKDTETGIASESARKYLFDITRRWMEAGVDGWRLDVAPDVPAPFWVEWRKLVKGINPDALIVGEDWGIAKSHLRGDQWDATMNYPFARAAVQFFIDRKRKTTASEFARQLEELLASRPEPVNFVMQNLYDSHDTDRLVNMIVNPDRDYDACNRPQDGCAYDGQKPGTEAYRVLKLMVTFQMTFVGAPMIWYGNEVGMFGADDPTCRKPMLWKDLMPYNNPQDVLLDDVLEHYRKLIAIRGKYPALRTGRYQTILTNDTADVFAFTRTTSNEVVTVMLNNRDREFTGSVTMPFSDGTPVMDVLSGANLIVREGKVNVWLTGKTGAILCRGR